MKLLRLKNKIQAGDFDRLADVERNILDRLDFTLEDCINTAYLRQRGYITAKEHEKLAKLGVRYSKLKRLPTLSFFTTSDYAIAQSFGDDDFGLWVGLAASYPLYDAGETRAMIEAAESQYRRSALDRRKKKEETSLAVREKYFALQSQMELLRLTREKEQRYAEDWESAQADFERGVISTMERDRIRHAHMLSMNRIRSLELDVMLAQSTLLRATGMNSFEELIP
jgi:outer membrane protein TolC